MRLLIVDDSALMRRMIHECFASEPGVEIGTARDGEDALEKLQSFEPDVITLDINMPRMDGLTCLAHIMERRPCPVVMVSSLSEKGAIATFEALELGAVDYVTKPDGTISRRLDRIFDELRAKVRAAANSVAESAPSSHERDASDASGQAAERLSRTSREAADLVLIGSSTGGPRALAAILEALPGDFPAPILIAQHMPPRFTKIYAQRLGGSCDLDVRELSQATPLEPGTAYIAPGAKDVEVSRQFRRVVARPVPARSDLTWHPSVTLMVGSALEAFDPTRLIGVMLTGMGDDGGAEMARIHHGGGRTIAESRDSAVIWGMPQALVEAGGATAVLPYDAIAAQLIRWSTLATSARRSACH